MKTETMFHEMTTRRAIMSHANAKRTMLAAICVASVAACALLTGCGAGSSSASSSQVVIEAGLGGTVYSGQQPIVGATVQLYAAGSTGYGSAYSYASGTSLLGNNAVQTQAGGIFTIQNDFTCPSASTLVYIEATGGNLTSPKGMANPNLALMTALGPCGQLTTSTKVMLNELTTVASVWALSPFMTGITNIGTSAANAQGLMNAFAAVNNIVNTGTGQLSGPSLPQNATLPYAKIDTLGDILADCVNSKGGIAGDGSACGTLFANSKVNGVAPTDTITAAMNIAQHPNQNVPALNSMVLPSAPFQPTLANPPNDFNIVISYSGNGLSAPSAVAVDASGNVWVPNSGANTVTELTNLGAPLSGASGYPFGSLNLPVAIAIDQSGNAWVANKGNNTVSEILAGGSLGNAYSGGNLSTPTNLAIDAYNNVWVANSGNSSLTKLTASGKATNYMPAGVSSPVGIAINPK